MITGANIQKITIVFKFLLEMKDKCVQCEEHGCQHPTSCISVISFDLRKRNILVSLFYCKVL
jgi:hypothetical protein